MPQIQRKFNVFIEGYSTHTEVEEVTTPIIRDLVEEVKAGGLIAPIDVPLGYQKLEGGFKLTSRSYEVMRHAGLTPGKSIRPTFRSVSVDDYSGDQQDEVIIMQGRLSVDGSNWQTGKSTMDYKLNTITYFKHTIAGKKTLYEIDLLNMIAIIDGVDQWVRLRSGLGL